MRGQAFLDFETKGIEGRPVYPPEPVGFSLQMPGERSAKHYAWGYKGGGNTHTKAQAAKVLTDLWKSELEIVFHHGKFDMEVAMETFGLPILPWYRFHDTLLLTFLYNPRLWSMKLKDVAEELLEIPADERDDLRAWILANVPAAKKKPSTWGAYIWLAPAKLAGRYANADVKMTKKLFLWLHPQIMADGMGIAYDRERQLLPVLLLMERRGVQVAHRELRRDLEVWKASEQEVARDIFRRLKIRKAQWEDYRSDGSYQGFTFRGDLLADAMEAAGKVEAFMLTAKGNRSVASDALREVCEDKALVDLLEEHSQITTCITTFGMPWLAVADRSGGRIFTNFNQVRSPEGGASTGRLSSYPNLQNVIRDDKAARVPKLRNYIIPGKGRIMVARDYSQQELRILGHFEGGSLYEKYMADPTLDAHDTIRKMVKDVADYDMARPAVKVLNFLQIYGGGIPAIQKKLKDLSPDQCSQLRKYHQQALPGVAELQKEIKAKLKAGEPIVTWGGRVYYAEESRIVDGRMRNFDYKMLNVLIQGSAADCTKQGMVNYYDMVGAKGWEAMPLELQVHDELVGTTAGDHKKMHRYLREAMAFVDFDIPMLSDGKTSRKSWGQMVKEKE